MQLIQYLICIASQHEQAKNEHEEDLKEFRRAKKNKKGKPQQQSYTLTYKDEEALLEGVFEAVKGKPPCLKKHSFAAISCLAYIIKAKVANEIYIEGHEIIDKLVCDPEKTITFLKGLGELNEHGWIRFYDKNHSGFTDQPPFCWLQSKIELGDGFHKEMGVSDYNISFASNDEYLDAVFEYLREIIAENSTYQIGDPKADLTTSELADWHRKIGVRVEVTTCRLPAAEVKSKYSLSIFQYLTMIGLLGQRDNDLNYEFSDPYDVSRLFSEGRVCRKLMREHLFGTRSRLKRQRLIEGVHGEFGDTIRLTTLGIKALTGERTGTAKLCELKKRIQKTTLFDYEVPKVKKEAVLLPQPTIEAIRSLIFSESKEGKKVRKIWHTSLPATWGSPTGSTVLLYGPPGTGKTLTAQYLASELKQPLLKVDASKILGCWVGESEQNVRRIFDDYTCLQKEFGKSPVLLLNEADQLLGSRGSGHGGVDRMNNNMQNLFLEGLERFSGVMVATTNRRDLLDDAFSRRFTYKLELPPPDKLLRTEIWKSHLPMARLCI